jgi:hypothetical protein
MPMAFSAFKADEYGKITMKIWKDKITERAYFLSEIKF